MTISATVVAGAAGASAIGPAQPGGQKGPAPHNKKKTASDLAGTEVYKVIQNSSPISALHEYCKKCKSSSSYLLKMFHCQRWSLYLGFLSCSCIRV